MKYNDNKDVKSTQPIIVYGGIEHHADRTQYLNKAAMSILKEANLYDGMYKSGYILDQLKQVTSDSVIVDGKETANQKFFIERDTLRSNNVEIRNFRTKPGTIDRLLEGN